MERFVQLTLTGLIGFVAIGQFIQVVTRYLLELPLMGLEESLLYPTLWLYILGAVNASRENTHIRANVLDIFITSKKKSLLLQALTDLLSLIIGAWLCYWAWDFTRYSLRVWKESPTLYLPTFYVDVALLAGMVLMLIYTSYHLINHLRMALNTDAETQND